MLDLAMKPDEAFKAPLNTTKLAPVTVEDAARALTRDDSERPAAFTSTSAASGFSPVRVFPAMLLA